MKPSEPVKISAPNELTAANCQAFRDLARSAIGTACTTAVVDLSGTRFIDSSGLGVFVSIHKILRERGGDLRLLDPVPAVRQILELTRMHRVFEIITSNPTKQPS